MDDRFPYTQKIRSLSGWGGNLTQLLRMCAVEMVDAEALKCDEDPPYYNLPLHCNLNGDEWTVSGTSTDRLLKKEVEDKKKALAEAKARTKAEWKQLWEEEELAAINDDVYSRQAERYKKAAQKADQLRDELSKNEYLTGSEFKQKVVGFMLERLAVVSEEYNKKSDEYASRKDKKPRKIKSMPFRWPKTQINICEQNLRASEKALASHRLKLAKAEEWVELINGIIANTDDSKDSKLDSH